MKTHFWFSQPKLEKYVSDLLSTSHEGSETATSRHLAEQHSHTETSRHIPCLIFLENSADKPIIYLRGHQLGHAHVKVHEPPIKKASGN